MHNLSCLFCCLLFWAFGLLLAHSQTKPCLDGTPSLFLRTKKRAPKRAAEALRRACRQIQIFRHLYVAIANTNVQKKIAKSFCRSLFCEWKRDATMALPAAVSSLRCRSLSRGRGIDYHERLFDEEDYGKGKPHKETKPRETRKPRGSFPTRASRTKRKEEDGQPLTHKGKTELAGVAQDLTEAATNDGHSEAKDERSFEELGTLRM